MAMEMPGIGDGNDTIAHIAVDYVTPASSTPDDADFQVGIDHIELIGFGCTSASHEMSHVHDVGGNAVFSDQREQITFFGVTTAELTASSFILS